MKRLRAFFSKDKSLLPYIAFIAVSLAIGSFMAGYNPDYTRALATWLTMTFAAIGLYIAINKYGFDLEEKSKKTLYILSSVNKKVFYIDHNKRQHQKMACIVNLKNDTDTDAQIDIQDGFDATILYKFKSNPDYYKACWDSDKKELIVEDTDALLIKKGESREFAFIKGSDSYPSIAYYFGGGTTDKNLQYLRLYIPR